MARTKSPLPPSPPSTSPLSKYQLPSFEPLDLNLTKGTTIPPPPPSPPRTPPAPAVKRASKPSAISTDQSTPSQEVMSPTALKSPVTTLAHEHSSIRRLMSFRSMSSMHSTKGPTGSDSPAAKKLTRTPSASQLPKESKRSRRGSFLFGSRRQASVAEPPSSVEEEGRRSPPPKLPELGAVSTTIDGDVFGKIG